MRRVLKKRREVAKLLKDTEEEEMERKFTLRLLLIKETRYNKYKVIAYKNNYFPKQFVKS